MKSYFVKLRRVPYVCNQYSPVSNIMMARGTVLGLYTPVVISLLQVRQIIRFLAVRSKVEKNYFILEQGPRL